VSEAAPIQSRQDRLEKEKTRGRRRAGAGVSGCGISFHVLNCGIGYLELCKTSVDQEICESPLDMVRLPDLVKRKVEALISKRWYHLDTNAQEA
jgi:hypothetical protein